MELFLEKCRIDQLDDLIKISRATFSEAFAHLNDPADFESYLNEAFSRQTIEKELRNSNSFFYFAFNKTETVGYFKLNRADAQTDLQDKDSLEIERIYVVKKYQGRRIGGWMVGEIIKMALKERFKYLWLGVWEVNKDAIRFYQSNGFKKFGEHPYYIGNDKQTDWLMRLDITTLRG